MLGYLAALAKACFGGNIELFVFFNGALEKARLHEWVKRQGNERQTAQQIVSHVQNKGTPPPKVWFLPPVCMAHCIRLALIRFHVKGVTMLRLDSSSAEGAWSKMDGGPFRPGVVEVRPQPSLCTFSLVCCVPVDLLSLTQKPLRRF
ncbi:constitutive coactivator of PPAR-gamma-like protein 2 [Cricetulus griseus]|nr:constitutive coactivator of PPAR-gamma-like protein 2 [Cricetulus griseus]